MLTRTLVLVLLASAAAPGADVDRGATHEGRRAIVVSNDKLALTVLEYGGGIAAVVLSDDPDRNNPLWDAMRNDRASGNAVRNSGATGHFVCVDGFGPVSAEEAAAGLTGHGEAADLPWVTVSAGANGGLAELVQTVQLPLVQEVYKRTISLRQGENVVRVHSELESQLAFDRPINWAEHATIGSPFLERGVTLVDMSANRAMVRPRGKPAQGRTHRLVGGDEFEWPLAPAHAGGKVDLRAAPLDSNTLDHTGHLMTPGGEHAWVTALHPGKRLLLGYVFKTSEYPWLQTWENYPDQGMLARGLEFGTQIFDLPRREMITEGKKFGEFLYRWLPAKSTIESTYLMFWTRAPADFKGVEKIEVEHGRLLIQGKGASRPLVLETSLGLD